MKILSLTSFLSERGGGIPPAIVSLYGSLAGTRLTLVLAAVNGPSELPRGVKFISYKAIGPRSFLFSPDLLKLLEVEQPDVVHLHGLWTYASIACQVWQYRY